MAEKVVCLVHDAIAEKNIYNLKYLVYFSNVPLEGRDQQGMTPLCHAVFITWPKGALFLLQHGADVQNAEMPCRPLIHLAVKILSRELLRRLIEKGASITVRDFEGEDCVGSVPQGSNFDLFKCVADAVTSQDSWRPHLDKDLLFITRLALKCQVNRQHVERFIKKQDRCHQRKMFEVSAACHVFAASFDLALRHGRLANECRPCRIHDHAKEEERAPRNVFSDILDLRRHPHLYTNSPQKDLLVSYILALFAIEKYIPEDPLITHAGLEVAHILLIGGEIVTVIGILWRLTNVRVLYRNEVSLVNRMLDMALKRLGDENEIPFGALFDSMRTVQKCLSSLTMDRCEARPQAAHSEVRKVLLKLFGTFRHIIAIFYGCKICATDQQLQSVPAHIKGFLHSFPWAQGQQSFHVLGCEESSFPNSATLTKILVAYSAETRGTIRSENSPPHLLSQSNGDTPLHTLAKFRTRKFLNDEGVLQCFLENGSDLCTRNNRGDSVRSILVRRGVFTEGELLPSLMCLAASAFMRSAPLRHNVQNCPSKAIRNFLMDHY